MRKPFLILTLIVIAAFAMSACQPALTEAELTATAQAGIPPVDETPLPVEMTPIVEETPPPAETPVEPELTPTVPPEETPPVEATPEAMQLRDENRLSQLLDFPVRNQQGDTLGDADEVIVDSETGQIHYLVVRSGGLLGIGGRTVLVLWEALQFDSLAQEDEDRAFVMNVDQETFENAPEVDLDTWPEVAIRDWDQEARAYWSQHIEILPVTGEVPEDPQALVRITDVSDVDVRNAADEEIGDIEEMIVNVETGQIQYLVLATGGVLDFGERLVALPWHAFTWDAENERFILAENIDPATLEAAPHFTELEEFPGAAAPDWDVNIRGYWDPIVGPAPQAPPAP